MATNPVIKVLELSDNNIGDDSAELIVASLKTNTNLVGLRLRGNKFTETGLKILYASIFDDTSLNAIIDCNHSCALKLFHDGEVIPDWLDEQVLAMNATPCGRIPMAFFHNVGAVSAKMVLIKRHEFDMKRKMLYALMGGKLGELNMHHLQNFPLEMMPELIDFIQYWGEFSNIEERKLDHLFQVVRSMPGVTAFHCTNHSQKQLYKKRRIA